MLSFLLNKYILHLSSSVDRFIKVNSKYDDDDPNANKAGWEFFEKELKKQLQHDEDEYSHEENHVYYEEFQTNRGKKSVN